MHTLSKELRKKLEDAVTAARRESMAGAQAILGEMGVGETVRPEHLEEEGARLRRRLRARGRQAGDVRKGDGSQEVNRLAREMAYEHWHRMLFARFLVENDLLLHPEVEVAVSMEECEEFAQEVGLDKWEMAARFAQKMLPGVFRSDDPVLAINLPREYRRKLEEILEKLPEEIFLSNDALGWTYQFWQKERKDEVNTSGEKIGARELPAVTQLFTEDYMVEFLLHNTLGAKWATKQGPLQAKNEAEARQMVALEEKEGIAVEWTYLRFVEGEDGGWVPAGVSDEEGKNEGDVVVGKNLDGSFTVLDPCMGSGHFLVFTLPLMVRIRMETEGLSAKEAVVAVLKENLFGLEIDPRCCQIGAFNLALAAWKLAGYQELPSLNIACCGIAPSAKVEEWVELAGENKNLRFGMRKLHQLFQQAPILGSLINPRTVEGAGFSFRYEDLQPLLEQALKEEKDEEAKEMAIAAKGIAKVADILSSQFTLVVTNVPYLGRGKQNDILANYCNLHYEFAKADLATCFIERCIELSDLGGLSALVTPQLWLFLSTYKEFRTNLLQEVAWRSVARLGTNAFETISGEVVNAALFIFEKQSPNIQKLITAFIADNVQEISSKKRILQLNLQQISQESQLRNPDSRVTLESSSSLPKLGEFVSSIEGLSTGDKDRFVSKFWEIYNHCNKVWSFFQSSPYITDKIDGFSEIIFWQNGLGALSNYDGARIQGHAAWDKLGVLVGRMGRIRVGIYGKGKYDKSCVVLTVDSKEHFLPVFTYCCTEEFESEIRKLDKKMGAATSVFLKIPFDLEHWQKVAAEKYPNGLPKPHSEDPTQWLFDGHPKDSERPLQVAVARLLGYRWPRQTGSEFPDCPALDADGLEEFADGDGIICLPAVSAEEAAATRLRALLHEALGDDYDEAKLIAAADKAAGGKGTKRLNLEDWLQEDFFVQHVKLFHNRPFIWHIWDGRKDGFHALVNYHKLAGPNGEARRTMNALIYRYLGDWIIRQEAGVKREEAGAEARLAAAQELKELLEKIVEGEPPFDLFVRWKPLHEQAIGWEPDLNDGLRINIRPFLAQDLSQGRKGAGVLRMKINVKWDKDRGKEPERAKEDYPWFWGWNEETKDF